MRTASSFTAERGSISAARRFAVGGATPKRVAAGPLATSGRGLQIVQMLADDWGVQPHDGPGKTVWFDLRVAPSEPMFAGGGQAGRDLAAVDWAATPLGPVEGWPRSLRTVVQMLVSSRFSMWMAWGPELTFLCNDAYRRDTLGRSSREAWAEIWPEIGPRIETVLQAGRAGASNR